MWHLTDICPLSCPYCFAAKTEAGLPLQLIKHIADVLPTLGVQKVDLSGGEPLAYDFLEEACTALWLKGIHTTLTTSGVGKRKNKEFVVRNAGRFARLIFSLDGYSEEHDAIRRKKGAWQDALDLMNMIDLADRKRVCRVNTVVTRPYYENLWGRKLGPAVDLLGVKEWCLIQPHPANQKEKYSEYSLDYASFLLAVEDSRRAASNVEILTRDNTLYSTYWNIQPNGNLQQHTNGSTDKGNISLILNDAAAVKKLVERTITIVPT
jgi:MoaA/NifB/PqqE/SkfB family radical SAM enzyme